MLFFLGIQEAVEQALSKSKSPDILVITLPFANVRSSQRQNINNYLKELPVTLPEGIWTLGKWKMYYLSNIFSKT